MGSPTPLLDQSARADMTGEMSLPGKSEAAYAAGVPEAANSQGAS